MQAKSSIIWLKRLYAVKIGSKDRPRKKKGILKVSGIKKDRVYSRKTGLWVYLFKKNTVTHTISVDCDRE